MTRTKWRYTRSGYGSSKADFDIVNEAGGRIASTPYEDKAALIAAAPELLEALERTLSWLTSYQGEAAMSATGPYEQARAAITKAKGKSK